MSSSPDKKPRLKRATPPAAPDNSDLGPIALSGPIIQNVVTPLRLEQADEDIAIDEITWLLYATNHLLTVHKKLAEDEILDRGQAVDWPLPASAEQVSEDADNNLVGESPSPGFTLEEAIQILWEPGLAGSMNNININLGNLRRQLSYETRQGATANADASLQNQIKAMQAAIIAELQTVAGTLKEAYGVSVTTPANLLAILAGQGLETNPLALGSLVSSTVIPSFGLEAEGEDWVDEELGWLFSAADNLLTAAQQLEATGSLAEVPPIAVPIPKNAALSVPTATNQLLTDVARLQLYDTIEEFFQFWHSSLLTDLNNIHTHLQGLQTFQAQETALGEAGDIDFTLQDSIKQSQLSVLKIVQNIVKTIEEAYGIQITSPAELLSLLEDEGETG